MHGYSSNIAVQVDEELVFFAKMDKNVKLMDDVTKPR